MKKLLIVTTINDLSIPLFLVDEVSTLVDVYFCFFHEDLNIIKQKLKSKKFDFIYIRDPFTDEYEEIDLRKKLNFIIRNSEAYLIDSINDTEDVFFEDKLIQYKLFHEFMPKTNILSNTDDIKELNYIIKKRISSRGKGIIFKKKGVPQKNINDYIVQEKLSIEKEYRVYVIFNQIIPTVSIKISKTETNKVKVVNVEKISMELKNFVKDIIVNNKFDFIGLDIAFFQGRYYLIEINRSCQFAVFYKQAKINLAELFVKKLLKRKLITESGSKNIF